MGRSHPESILIEILAKILLRIIAKQKSEVIKSDSVNQNDLDEESNENENLVIGNNDFLAKKDNGFQVNF